MIEHIKTLPVQPFACPECDSDDIDDEVDGSFWCNACWIWIEPDEDEESLSEIASRENAILDRP